MLIILWLFALLFRHGSWLFSLYGALLSVWGMLVLCLVHVVELLLIVFSCLVKKRVFFSCLVKKMSFFLMFGDKNEFFEMGLCLFDYIMVLYLIVLLWFFILSYYGALLSLWDILVLCLVYIVDLLLIVFWCLVKKDLFFEMGLCLFCYIMVLYLIVMLCSFFLG